DADAAGEPERAVVVRGLDLGDAALDRRAPRHAALVVDLQAAGPARLAVHVLDADHLAAQLHALVAVAEETGVPRLPHRGRRQEPQRRVIHRFVLAAVGPRLARRVHAELAGERVERPLIRRLLVDGARHRLEYQPLAHEEPARRPLRSGLGDARRAADVER